MKFSEIYKITDGHKQEWFDPILTLDTFLFIDPFLLYDLESDEFQGSHADVIELFNAVFKLIAKSKGNKNSFEWKKAITLMMFPEVEELCLGYTDFGTGGSGSGIEVAKLMASGIWNAINSGKENLKHFEELQLFQERIGRDRISDATAKIIRSRLAAYTYRICCAHNIELHEVTYPAGKYDVAAERWKAAQFQLPMNPYNGKPILLVPKKYLNSLPTINPDSFWTYCYGRDNKSVRKQFGEDIGKHVDKETILKYVAENVDIEEEYVEKTAQQKANPYDLDKDPQGVYSWYEETKVWVHENPIEQSLKSQQDLLVTLDVMLDRFEHYIQNNGGWELLWNDNNWTAKKEKAAQVLFLGVIKHYCQSKDIDVSKEPNIGRGPVDFKLSHGYEARALIEVKKANNTKFWDGLQKQLPKYLEAEEIKYGCFLVMCYSDADFERVKDIQAKVKELNQKLPYKMNVKLIDATRPISASLL